MDKKRKVEKCLEVRPNEWSFSRIFRIMREFVLGYRFLDRYGKAVTFFGSARCTVGSEVYNEAAKLAGMLVKDDFAIITGGGPGIMEAANKGARDARGESVGLNIELPNGQRKNKYVTESMSFYYFFTRKVMLSFASEAYIFFPGGFGTLDEFFELVTLIQTRKIQPTPIVLVGRDYWTPLLEWIEKGVYGRYNAIDADDMQIYHLVDTADEAFPLIQTLVRETGVLRCE
ncbi:MAG: TIGR00730 family Rossman fold protein [Candidatus Lloydbacteria bacterium CG22_combo_CG10-13_8_21_14_all_47_15]|uniref:Cytokinin riboside 5'-monophosphate phosphoribohydrolase n=1 Tax=Candidatus Lloydbacteria bacterium CG22_combo_CG10-13_8_21_14_all_47_15 TaxID=1974635 RepID=A0A2H0CV74_9BACT|nr:MAG: TIGR00730 family Rossman fold protein [Candidatus Lloydbacteria bacterium CG22_combo_CG10-13_8_21_14_all_47_15]